MSIDHGKVLALADDIENRGDKWAADKLRAIAQPSEQRSDGSDWLDYAVTPAEHEQRRKHFAAQPAEAVESPWIADLRNEAMRGARKDVYWLSRDQVFELIGDAAGRKAPAQPDVIVARSTDAAQGAVATDPNWCRTCGNHRTDPRGAFCSDSIHLPRPQAAPAQGCGLTLPDSRLDAALDLLCGLTGEHRQRITDDARMDHLCDTARQIAALSAPAQGDGREWVAGYMQGANDYVGGAQGALDQDELRADAEMARRHYAAELAAAPSQEGE